MDPVKRRTILKEIEYWRSSKLLPELTCDFLRNLYVDQPEEAAGHVGRPRSIKRLLSFTGWLVASLSIVIILLLSIYFTVFHPVLQISFAVLLVALLLTIGWRRRRQYPFVAVVSLGFGSSLSILFGVFLLHLRDLGTDSWRTTLLGFCGIIWIALGIVSLLIIFVKLTRHLLKDRHDRKDPYDKGV